MNNSKTYQQHLGIAMAVIKDTETNSETVKVLGEIRLFLNTLAFQVTCYMIESIERDEDKVATLLDINEQLTK